MSILAILISGLLMTVAGIDGVAIYTAGWQVVFFAIIPLVAIGISVISIAGAPSEDGNSQKYRPSMQSPSCSVLRSRLS